MTFKILTVYLFTFLFFSTSAFADPDLANRMKTRLPDVLAAKASGMIGEGMNGMLAIRGDSSAQIKNLVTAENQDRSALFKLMAKKTGGEVKDVAKMFAKKIASKAQKGHWFKNSSGNWVSK